jgi:uncharacterized protein YodC (DUF2158 family)
VAEIVDLKSHSTTEEPFIIGSVVKLKSGGADMTVRKLGRSTIDVEWHNSSYEPVTYSYHPAMLCHVNVDEVGVASS